MTPQVAGLLNIRASGTSSSGAAHGPGTDSTLEELM